jgi:hypothetical protein
MPRNRNPIRHFNEKVMEAKRHGEPFVTFRTCDALTIAANRQAWKLAAVLGMLATAASCLVLFLR